MAKSNMTMMGARFAEGLPNGWSPLGGQTINTFGPDLRTSGSSSGSAFGVSAGFAPCAIGTDTCGSIVGFIGVHYHGDRTRGPDMYRTPRRVSLLSLQSSQRMV